MESIGFVEIFNIVLQRHRLEFCVSDADIRTAIREINYSYSKKGQCINCVRDHVDFNKPAYRCAYLYKHAGFHAAMVDYVLSSYLKYTGFLKSIPLGPNDAMNICCLGGGPGIDMCGLSNILLQELEVKKFRLTTVDIMEGWVSAFATLLEVAQQAKYHCINRFFSAVVSNRYICDDLCSPGHETKKALKSADLITMIKFVSALKRERVKDMLKALFRELKPGAVVLFIDNAAGGFQEIVSQAASECCLTQFCGALRHILFRNNILQHRMFDTNRLCSTIVTAQIWVANTRSSVPTENISRDQSCTSPYFAKIFSLPASSGVLMKSSTGTKRQINIATVTADEHNEESFIQSDVETNVNFKTSNSTRQISPTLTVQNSFVFYDEQDVLQMYKNASFMKDSVVVNTTNIQQNLTAKSDVSLNKKKLVEDSVLQKNGDGDLHQRHDAECSSEEGNQGNKHPENQKRNEGTEENEIGADRERKTVVESIKKSFRVEDVRNTICGNQQQGTIVNKSSKEESHQNSSYVELNCETDYESVSVFVFAVLIILILSSYYFK